MDIFSTIMHTMTRLSKFYFGDYVPLFYFALYLPFPITELKDTLANHVKCSIRYNDTKIKGTGSYCYFLLYI